jgi:molecular chaperone HtpG
MRPSPLPTAAEQCADQSRDLVAFNQFSLPGVRDQVVLMLGMIGGGGFFYTYTRHDISHIDAMLRMLDWLVPEPTKQAMTPADWLLTVLAIYFHDLGMLATEQEYVRRNEDPGFRDWFDALDKDDEGREYLARAGRRLRGEEKERFFFQEYVRKTHAGRIREWITGRPSGRWGDQLNAAAQEVGRLMAPLPSRFREHLGTVCESHHEDDLTDPLRFPLYDTLGTDLKRECVNVQYAAILLRTTDLLHVTHDRTPSVMFKLIPFTDPKSVLEWEKQRGAFAVAPRARVVKTDDPETTDIIIKADFSEEEPLFALQEYIVYADAQVRQSKRWADKSQETDDGAAYQFPWRGIRPDVRLQGVQPSPMKFELDRGRLLNLLVGHTIYNDPTVAIRELLQNAIDAVRYQHHLARREALALGREPPPMGVVRVCWDPRTRTLIVEDRGVGMDRDVIQNHLMKVGSSFYTTPKFEAEHRDFTPISRFGIGILTCFMISDDVEIVTCRASKGYRIRMTSVQADYLLRELPARDSKLEGLAPHGTRLTLVIRESVNFKKRSVADILRYWIILPECRVEYVEEGKEAESIGFTSAAESLEYSWRMAAKADAASQAKLEFVTRRAEFTPDGPAPPGSYELATAVEVGWYPERPFAQRRNVDQPAVCVEGIRVANALPWFDSPDEERRLSSLLSIRNNRLVRTTVSRSALEQDEGYDRLGGLCVTLLAEYIRDEVDRIARLPGRPLSQASSACYLLSQRLRNASERKGRATLDDALKRLPAVVVEGLAGHSTGPCSERTFISREELRHLKEFWTMESRLVEYLGIIGRDLGRELSLGEFLRLLAPDYTNLRYPLVLDASQFLMDLERTHRPEMLEFSRRHLLTTIQWKLCPKDDPLGRRQLLAWTSDHDMKEEVDRWISTNIGSIARRRGEFMVWPEAWVAPMRGDVSPCVAVITTLGIVFQPESEPARRWVALERALAYFVDRGTMDRVGDVIGAAWLYIYLIHYQHGKYRHDYRGNETRAWRDGLKAIHQAARELGGLPADFPEDYRELMLPRKDVFSVRSYWREWIEE